MDDRSLISCAVRRLVTEQTCCDSNDVLPLSLVRWKEPNHRFDQEYYLNSLVHLHLLLESLIGVIPPADPMDEKQVETFIDSINERLGLPENRNSLVADGISLRDYFKEKYLDENGEVVTPFSDLPQAFLPSALAGFDRRFKPWLVKFLMEFKPYRQVLSYARENSLIEGIFGQFLAQPKGHQEELRNELETKHGANWRTVLFEDHIRKILTIKAGESPDEDRWPFKSIFQKAMARLLKVIAYDNVDAKPKFGDVETFLEFFDILDDAGKLKVHVNLPACDDPDNHSFELWTFIALHPTSGNIKVTKKVENRIFATLALWYFGYRYAFTKGLKISAFGVYAEDRISVGDIADAFSRKGIQNEWPVNEYYAELFETFVQTAYLVAGKDSRGGILEVRERNIARQRIVTVMGAGLEPFIARAASAPEPNSQEEQLQI